MWICKAQGQNQARAAWRATRFQMAKIWCTQGSRGSQLHGALVPAAGLVLMPQVPGSSCGADQSMAQPSELPPALSGSSFPFFGERVRCHLLCCPSVCAARCQLAVHGHLPAPEPPWGHPPLAPSIRHQPLHVAAAAGEDELGSGRVSGEKGGGQASQESGCDVHLGLALWILKPTRPPAESTVAWKLWGGALHAGVAGGIQPSPGFCISSPSRSKICCSLLFIWTAEWLR